VSAANPLVAFYDIHGRKGETPHETLCAYNIHNIVEEPFGYQDCTRANCVIKENQNYPLFAISKNKNVSRSFLFNKITEGSLYFSKTSRINSVNSPYRTPFILRVRHSKFGPSYRISVNQ
jgi:hypothetical protein